MTKKTMFQLALASTLLLAACGKKDKHEGPMESAGEEVDNAAADVSEKTEEGAEDTGDAVEEAGDAVQDETN